MKSHTTEVAPQAASQVVKVDDVEKSRSDIKTQIIDLKIKQAELQHVIVKLGYARLNLEGKLTQLDRERKKADEQQKQYIADARIAAFKQHYHDLYKNKTLSSRINTTNFVLRNEKLSTMEFRKKIDLAVKDRPDGTVAHAWDLAQKSAIQEHKNEVLAKILEEREHLLEIDDQTTKASIDLMQCEESIASLTSQLADLNKPIEPPTIQRVATDDAQPKSVVCSELKADAVVKENELEQIIFAFKKIYKALHDGQTAFWKSNFMQGRENLAAGVLKSEIETHIKDHADGRAAAAWNLAKTHYKNVSEANVGLFSDIYSWCYSHSNSLVKASHVSGTLFSAQGRKEFTPAEIKSGAEKDNSRTSNICKALRV